MSSAAYRTQAERPVYPSEEDWAQVDERHYQERRSLLKRREKLRNLWLAGSLLVVCAAGGLRIYREDLQQTWLQIVFFLLTGGQAVAVSIFEAIHVHNDPRALSELEAVHRKEVRCKLVGS